jgi:hypothetical protein
VRVLLRQPNGFEGFGAIRERFRPEDLSGPQPKCGQNRRFSFGATCLAAPFGVASREDGRPGVDELPQDYLKMVIGICERLEVGIHTFRAVKHGFDADEDRPKLDVWIVEIHERLHISAVVGLDPSPHDLHVLLRHHPRSIPQAQESA